MGIPLESAKGISDVSSEKTNLASKNQKLPTTTVSSQKSRNSRRQSNRLATDAIGFYLTSIGKVPLLTPAEEIELSKHVQDMKSILEKVAADNEETFLLGENVQENRKNPLSSSAANDAKKDIANSKFSSADKFSITNREISKNLKTLFEIAKKTLPAKEKRKLRHSKRSRDRMMDANLRLVVSVAKKYQNQGLELLDLVQEGAIGLERAVDKFDPAMGYKFSTYAYWWIRQGMTRAIDNSARTIRLPIHISEKLSKMRRITRELSHRFGRQPNRLELANAMGIEPQDLEDLVSQSAPCASLDAHARGEEDRSTLGELIPDPNYDEPMEGMDRSIQKEHLRGWLSQLNEREQKIMRLRFGLDGAEPLTLAEIGRQISVSRERVRQLEAKAILKLRVMTTHQNAA